MPIQVSNRATPVTGAEFTAPFQSSFVRFGVKGLNVNDAIDAIEPNQLTRMLNVTHRIDDSVVARAGQSPLYTAGTKHHTIGRLNTSTGFTRFVGVDTSLYMGDTSIASVSSGFSGYPLSFLPTHPVITGDSWMYVADSNKMLKVRSDGLALPVGLPAPASAATAALVTEQKTTIANYTDDGTQSANWTANPGATYDTVPVPVDTEVFTISDGPDGLNALQVGCLFPQTNLNGYYGFWGCPVTRDLSKVGTLPATDDDLIQVQLNFTHTAFIKELRIYFVCGATFSPSILPGAANGGGANADFYFKSFSTNEFSAYVQAQATQLNAAEVARVAELRTAQVQQSSPNVSDLRRAQFNARFQSYTYQPVATTLANTDPSLTIAAINNAGSDQWQPFGITSYPLRRGDFQRVGFTSGRDWSTITGIVVYYTTSGNDPFVVGTTGARISGMYLTGGYGPDTTNAEDSPYDYRYTHYDPRTGVEGNPSPVMNAANSIDTLRRAINVTPVSSYGDGNVRQRIYRRGGTLPTDWYLVGTNASDGGVFTDTASDTTAVDSTTVETDNFQPVPTVTSSGASVYGQPLNRIWGPLHGLVFGCGDPYRPGYVYFSKPGNPDVWPDTYLVEVSPASDAILTGCLYGGQAFCFSEQRCFVLYPNFGSDAPTVTASTTQCTRGPLSRWALTVGIGGMYFVANDGLYRTVGGPEEWLSKDIDPLFNGKSKNGYYPIDFTDIGAIHLSIFENELYFTYKDTQGTINTLVYSIPYGFWRSYQFANPPACFFSDTPSYSASTQAPLLLIGGRSSGKTYTYAGTSDDGTAISCSFRTGALDFGSPRLEKRFGDQSLDLNAGSVAVTLQNYLDFETVTEPAVTLTGTTGRQTVIFDDVGTTPLRAKNLSTNISWSTAGTSPEVFQLGTTVINEPDITMNRVTQWDDLGHPDASYVTGLTLDCDTGGQARTIIIEYDYQGTVSTAATLTVNANGRHKLKFSWSAVRANMVRVRPNDACIGWQLFRADWMAQPEPPDIAGWDVYYENKWDQYYTGLDLYCDTHGATKTVLVYVDNVLVQTESVLTNGRAVHHITLPWGRGHVFHFVATDANPGILYDYRWQLQAEPSEQANWNQNFTIQEAPYDKWLKAIVVECDTFGLDKTVTVEIDGTVVETLTINTNGRKVVQKAFPKHLGRVFRVYPTDANPSRIYSLVYVFDGDPYQLDRWETEEITHGVQGWSYATHAHVTVRSTADVTLQVIGYNQSGTATTKSYTIPSTGGVKVKAFVPLQAMKGILHRYILTSAEPFHLFQEETVIYVRDWNTALTHEVHPFGDSDQDPTRNMFNAALSAARPGGEA
jgi:hypothetical protein